MQTGDDTGVDPGCREGGTGTLYKGVGDGSHPPTSHWFSKRPLDPDALSSHRGQGADEKPFLEPLETRIDPSRVPGSLLYVRVSGSYGGLRRSSLDRPGTEE